MPLPLTLVVLPVKPPWVEAFLAMVSWSSGRVSWWSLASVWTPVLFLLGSGLQCWSPRGRSGPGLSGRGRRSVCVLNPSEQQDTQPAVI